MRSTSRSHPTRICVMRVIAVTREYRVVECPQRWITHLVPPGAACQTAGPAGAAWRVQGTCVEEIVAGLQPATQKRVWCTTDKQIVGVG